MMNISFVVPDDRYEEIKDLLRTCVDTEFPYVDTKTAEYFLKKIEDEQE